MWSRLFSWASDKSSLTSTAMAVGEQYWDSGQKWRECKAALETLFLESEARKSFCEDEPSPQAILATLRKLREYEAIGSAPPSIVVKEPCGGVVVEFGSGKFRSILTVYNSLMYEFDTIFDGKIIETEEGSIDDDDLDPEQRFGSRFTLGANDSNVDSATWAA